MSSLSSLDSDAPESPEEDDSYFFFNKVLHHLWPHISDWIRDILLTKVEPKVKEKLPWFLAGISLNKNKLHLGHSPPKVYKLKSEIDERGSSEHGCFRCLRMVATGEWKSNCEIELEVVGGATVGVKNAKLRGTMVTELFHLLSGEPLVEGVRIYFADIPELDLNMIGSAGSMFNVTVLKNLIMETILEQLGEIVVLPQRIVVPMTFATDVIKMKGPRPDGVLTLVVKELQGLKKVIPHESTRWYACFTIGSSAWRTPTRKGTTSARWEEANTVDFVVHDRHAQHLDVTLYIEEHSRLWGAYPGDVIARCHLSVARLTDTGCSKWWPLQDCNAENGNEGDGDHDSAASVSTRYFSKVRRTSTLSADFLFSQLNSMEPLSINFDSEWHQLTRVRHHTSSPSSGASLGDCCNINAPISNCKADGRAVAVILVGIREAYNLPRSCAKYWCSMRCTNVASDHFKGSVGQDGIAQKTTKRVKGQHEQKPVKGLSKWDPMTNTWKTIPPREVSVMSASEPSTPTSPTSESRDSMSSSIVATWNATFFFHLKKLKGAKVSIALCGESSNFGRLECDLEQLLHETKMEMEYDGPLNANLRKENGIATKPGLRILLRLWITDGFFPPHSEGSTSSNTQQQPVVGNSRIPSDPECTESHPAGTNSSERLEEIAAENGSISSDIESLRNGSVPSDIGQPKGRVMLSDALRAGSIIDCSQEVVEHTYELVSSGSSCGSDEHTAGYLGFATSVRQEHASESSSVPPDDIKEAMEAANWEEWLTFYCGIGDCDASRIIPDPWKLPQSPALLSMKVIGNAGHKHLTMHIAMLICFQMLCVLTIDRMVKRDHQAMELIMLAGYIFGTLASLLAGGKAILLDHQVPAKWHIALAIVNFGQNSLRAAAMGSGIPMVILLVVSFASLPFSMLVDFLACGDRFSSMQMLGAFTIALGVLQTADEGDRLSRSQQRSLVNDGLVVPLLLILASLLVRQLGNSMGQRVAKSHGKHYDERIFYQSALALLILWSDWRSLLRQGKSWLTEKTEEVYGVAVPVLWLLLLVNMLLSHLVKSSCLQIVALSNFTVLRMTSTVHGILSIAATAFLHAPPYPTFAAWFGIVHVVAGAVACEVAPGLRPASKKG